MTIQFGTSGWRAVIADEFTFAGVRSVEGDICSHFGSKKKANDVMVVGYDTRCRNTRGQTVPQENVSRQWSGGAARSVATSPLVNRVAEARGLPVYETPVGFKYIGELINENKIVIGGEESAGLSIQGHYPEKDGILACLLAAEAVAARGASLTDQLNDL